MVFSQAAGVLAAVLIHAVPGSAANSVPTEKSPAPVFAIYTLAESLDRRVTMHGTGAWSQVKLSPAPLITEADILNYDFTTHTMRLTQEARARLPRPPVSGTPFVVTAEGQPIYLGVFTTGLSSMCFAVPSIMVDGQFIHSNLSPSAVVIDRAYPTAQFGVGPDPRGDPRIRQALEKRVSLAPEVDAADLLTALRPLLPKDWTLRHYLDAQPYGLEASFLRGVGFVFAGPTEVEGPKGEPTHEGFTLVIMPDEFLGHPIVATEAEAGLAGTPSRFLDWTVERKVWLKVFCESVADTPTWPTWQTDVKRALGIPLKPVSVCINTHNRWLAVTTNDVVLLTRADGRKAAVQFTKFGVKTATYCWRYAAPDSERVQAGTGAVFEKEPYDKSPEALALPKHDCSVRVGEVHWGWSYGGTNKGYLYFHPSRERVQFLTAGAFSRVP